jgi:hypothetical protein
MSTTTNFGPAVTDQIPLAMIAHPDEVTAFITAALAEVSEVAAVA